MPSTNEKKFISEYKNLLEAIKSEGKDVIIGTSKYRFSQDQRPQKLRNIS